MVEVDKNESIGHYYTTTGDKDINAVTIFLH